MRTTKAAGTWVLSDAGIAQFAGQDLTTVAQGDIHLAAAHTASQVSGATTSLYTHQGGLQVRAAEGPVALRAHTDTLGLLADPDIQILSVGDEITILAKTRIELTGGDSSIVLDGADCAQQEALRTWQAARFLVQGSAIVRRTARTKQRQRRWS